MRLPKYIAARCREPQAPQPDGKFATLKGQVKFSAEIVPV